MQRTRSSESLPPLHDSFEAQLEAQKGAGADLKLEKERLEELVAKLKKEIEANSVLRERMQTEKQAEDSYVKALNEEIEAFAPGVARGDGARGASARAVL